MSTHMRKWGYGLLGVLLGALLLATPAAQTTIRNITVLTMPADATELPAATAAADNTANPTAPFVLSANMCWDGSTWDRCAAADGGAGAVSSATARVTLASDDPSQTGGSVSYRTATGVTEDETEVKATAGRLLAATLTNTNAAARYFRCYNLTAAATTPGASTVLLGFAVPGGGVPVSVTFGPGAAFSTALTCTLTTGAADTDVAEVAANEVKWTLVYK